jgi:hypothetical protein
VKPLLERNPDLALVGRSIFVKPVHHFARAILVDRRGNPDVLYPDIAVLHVFELRRWFSISWSEFIPNETSSRPGLWFITEPNVQENLLTAFEKHALPALRAMRTLDDYLNFVSSHHMRHQLFDWAPQRFILEIALGNFAAARCILDENRVQWSADHPNWDDEDQEFYAELRLMFARLDADDWQGMAALLHTWEARTVRNLKIEHLWEPESFPLELAR